MRARLENRLTAAVRADHLLDGRDDLVVRDAEAVDVGAGEKP
jgi:hypothetical protein